MSQLTSLAAWEKIQAKTFSKWINAQLKGSSVVNDITVDLQDGQILARLLQALSGDIIQKINAKPSMRIQKVENVGKCIRFITDHDVKLVGIGAEEIVDGNPKMTLGLIWTLILRFVIVGLSEDGLSVKQGLLLWCQKKCEPYKNVKIENFTTSWQDGLGLCALIHRHRPDLIKYDELTKDNALANLNLAFDVAEQFLGVPKILDAVDIVDTAKPDEKSIMTYIAQLYTVFSSLDQVEVAGRRVGNFLNFVQQIQSMSNDYEKRVRALHSEIDHKSSQFSQAQDVDTYAEVKASLVEFKEYRRTKRRQMVQEKDDLSTLFTSIQTKLRFQKMPPYSPPEGLLPSDTEKHLNELGGVETARRRQLNANMNAIKSKLERNFGDLANGFHNQIQEYKHTTLQDIGIDLQGALDKLNGVLGKVRSHASGLATIEKAEKLCEEANIESNEYTDHTFDDLSFEILQVEKLINKTIAAVQGQIAASSGSGISAEQMKQYKETFDHFDVDKDNTLNRLEFKSALTTLGLIGIDFEGADAKFERIFSDVSGGADKILFDHFVEYMNRLSSSSMDQAKIAESFNTMAGGKNFVTVQDCQVAGFQPEEIEFVTLSLPPLAGHEGAYDYNTYLANKYK
jgi:hypothetical protein